MDTIEVFMSKLEEEIEDIPSGTFFPELNYRDIESWSSMHALIIIAFISTEYDVTLTGENLKSCNTLQELFDLVSSKV